MRVAVRSNREIQMYGSVREFLRERQGCKHVFADLPGEKKMHLPRNLSKRDPDVVGITEEDEVHLAEGKLLARSGQPFEQCVEQSLSLKEFADYLYVFFPWEDWDRLPEDDKISNKSHLRERGIGLLLVDVAEKCHEILRSSKNTDAKTAKKDELRRQLGMVAEEDVAKLGCLSSTDALAAISIIDCFMDCGMKVAEKAIYNVFKKKVKKWEHEVVKDKGVSKGFFFFADFYEEKVGVDLDVFGGCLGDGRSCMWVTRDMNCATLLPRLETRFPEFGTHLRFGEKGFVPSLRDVKPVQILKSREKSLWLLHRVEFFGRSTDGLRMELEALLTAAKRLR